MQHATYARLKYQIITPDSNTWYLCKTYPRKARVAWALRCAKDVMHLVSNVPEVAACIAITEQWLDGKATEAEVSAAADAASDVAADAAVCAAATREQKWELYISWLVEELSKEQIN